MAPSIKPSTWQVLESVVHVAFLVFVFLVNVVFFAELVSGRRSHWGWIAVGPPAFAMTVSHVIVLGIRAGSEARDSRKASRFRLLFRFAIGNTSWMLLMGALS